MWMLLFFHAGVIAQKYVLEKGIDKLQLVGCNIRNKSIIISGTGDIQRNRAFFPSETTLEEIEQVFNITIVSYDKGAIRFGIGKQSKLAGTLVDFAGNDTSSKVVVNRVNEKQVIPVREFELPFALAIGHQYKIRVAKKIRHLIVEISSGNYYFKNDTLQYPTPFFGLLWGSPFIACHSGKIEINGFVLKTSFKRNPLIAVWGDSFIEGSSLASEEERYISFLKSSLGYRKIVILGRGGESSTSLDKRYPKELEWFKRTKYALIAIGTNDSDFDVWKSNMTKYISMAEKLHVKPIIVTITPRYDIAGRVPFMQMVNRWIREEYNGLYVDMNKAVTLDGERWIEGLLLADKVHPSAAGHLAMFERIKMDAPFLF